MDCKIHGLKNVILQSMVIHISQKLKVKIAKKANYKPYAFRVPHAL